MGVLSKIFGNNPKAKSSDQVEFIRYLIGREIKRGNETFDCNSIPDDILLGLPEYSGPNRPLIPI